MHFQMLPAGDEKMKEKTLKFSVMSTPISMLTDPCITDREDYWPNSKGLTEITETKVKMLGRNTDHHLSTVLLACGQKQFGLAQ